MGRSGVEPRSVEVEVLDHGLTGTNRARPGLRESLAACRAVDTLVVTKLDRLARSLPDARDIVDELFSVARSTVYRAIERARTAAPETS